MTLIEFKHFAKWFVRDIAGDVYRMVMNTLGWLFRAPMTAVKSHAQEYRDDHLAAWARMIVTSLCWLCIVMVGAQAVALVTAPDRATLLATLSNALVVSTSILAVYMLSVLVVVKVTKFRSERERLMQSLTGSDK